MLQFLEVTENYKSLLSKFTILSHFENFDFEKGKIGTQSKRHFIQGIFDPLVF
jgi:hypothetical protein